MCAMRWRFGKDTYNDGRLSHEIVEEMCEVLNKFRK